MKPALICINRPWRTTTSPYPFAVVIDEKKVGHVWYGAEATFQVIPGRHSIYITLWWMKSEPCVIDLEPGQNTSLVCEVKELFKPVQKLGGRGRFSYLMDLVKEGAKEQANAMHLAYPLRCHLHLRPQEGPVEESETQSGWQEQVLVHLENEEERVPSTTEQVLARGGVKIKVKRSRKVEHTVVVDWTVTGEARLEAGYEHIVSGSIRGEISQKQGQTVTESETVEYEVELDGEKCSRYQLKWIDIWRKGAAKFTHKGVTQVVRFRYREKSELEVVPGWET